MPTAQLNPMERVARKASREVRRLSLACIEHGRTTYAPGSQSEGQGLNRFLTGYPFGAAEAAPNALEVVRLNLEHYFNLLGSGWTRLEHGMRCRGLQDYQCRPGERAAPDTEGKWLDARINRRNLAESKRIWRMLDRGYYPIDWHLDFKSGYRWRESTWHGSIRYGHKAWVDVKIPWELARMQHLPQLALAFGATGKDFLERDSCLFEFRNQVLDFVAVNPPRFGVNWSSTMDVAIRVANWLVSHDLFLAAGASFDPEFEAVFARSVYEHGRYIYNHPERGPGFNGNHYLAGIAGLLFAAAYLPRSAEVDEWLVFGVKELVVAVSQQFGADGSNFEASTAYHRLSAEMADYASALVLGLPRDKREALGKTSLSPNHLDRLQRMADFTEDLMDDQGRVEQIGDNDSGRFFRFQPRILRMSDTRSGAHYLGQDNSGLDYLIEDELDHRHLTAAMDGLFRRNPAKEWIDTKVVSWLAHRGVALSSEDHSKTSSQPSHGMKFSSYPDFGLYVYRWDRVHLMVRCGSVGQNGTGGHAHNDQLSFVLSLDGCPVFVDPGTYLYTPSLESRNLFRSTSMHSTLSWFGREQNPWPKGKRGIFALNDQARPQAVQVESQVFMGEHYGFGAKTARRLEMRTSQIEGLDLCAAEGTKEIAFHLSPGVKAYLSSDGEGVTILLKGKKVFLTGGPGTWEVRDGLYSPAYGILQRTRILVLRSGSKEVHWQAAWEDRA